MTRTDYSVRAAVRVLDILDALRDAENGLSLPDLAAAAGLPKSSAFRYLATLESRGYVNQDGISGHYRIGLGVLPTYTHHLEVLRATAHPVLQELRDRYQETINLGVLDSNRVLYLDIVESPKAMRFAARRGDRDPIHCTALGKAIAYGLPEADVRAILVQEGMSKHTRRTIADPDRFLNVLAAAREHGYALDDQENEEDGRCVAVPIARVGVKAALSLSAPSSRCSLDDVDEVAASLRAAAERISGTAGRRVETSGRGR